MEDEYNYQIGLVQGNLPQLLDKVSVDCSYYNREQMFSCENVCIERIPYFNCFHLATLDSNNLKKYYVLNMNITKHNETLQQPYSLAVTPLLVIVDNHNVLRTDTSQFATLKWGRYADIEIEKSSSDDRLSHRLYETRRCHPKPLDRPKHAQGQILLDGMKNRIKC